MNIINYIANKVWISLCSVESRKYQQSMKNVRKEQEDILLSIIKTNRLTEYGEKYRFSEIKNIQGYQDNVPVTDYDNYRDYIHRMMQGESNVLTSEQVTMFELSSGSTAPSKLIPYTKSLKKQFIAGINPWIKNLYHSYCELYKGKAYWSITPVNTKNSKTPGGIPIGFEEDTEYFGFLERHILSTLFAVPGEVKHISDMDCFRYITLLFLLKEKWLTLISVWNPTFLILLLKPLENWKDGLLEDLKNGTIHPPKKVSAVLIEKLKKMLGKNPKRVYELQGIFEDSEDYRGYTGKTVYECVWPHLKLISCWTDANAGMHIQSLRKLFPSVEIQGKGLISTEGFVSLPYVGEDGARLSVRSHFFEFEEMGTDGNRTGRIKLAHELKLGCMYSVILTTGGGLYRYRLRDMVNVVGFAEECPRVKFMGKESMISDLCGEKLHEYHVKQSVEEALKHVELKPVFFMAAPETEGIHSYYVLFLELDRKEKTTFNMLADLITRVEEGLLQNFHYKYCRNIGQLQHIRLFIIDNSEGYQGLETYHKVCRELGQRDGDIKTYALHNRIGWTKRLKGNFV